MIFFIFLLKTYLDCGYSLEPARPGCSNECPQSLFLSRNKKNNVYAPVNPSFVISKRGLRGLKLYGHVFVMQLYCSNVRTSMVRI